MKLHAINQSMRVKYLNLVQIKNYGGYAQKTFNCQSCLIFKPVFQG